MNDVILEGKLFKCVLKRRLKRTMNETMANLNQTLDNYLVYHSYTKGDALLYDSGSKFVVNGMEDNAELNTLLDNVTMEDEFDRARFAQSRISSEIGEDDDGKIIVSLFLNDKVGISYLHFITGLLDELGPTNTTCLIVAKSVNPNFKKELMMLQVDSEYTLILYTDDHFIDIKHHSFSPKQPRIYRGNDQLALTHIRKEELPKMLLNDPYAKYFMLKKDDIIELERETGVGDSLLDTTIVYRHVVATALDVKGLTGNDIETID